MPANRARTSIVGVMPVPAAAGRLTKLALIPISNKAPPATSPTTGSQRARDRITDATSYARLDWGVSVSGSVLERQRPRRERRTQRSTRLGCLAQEGTGRAAHLARHIVLRIAEHPQHRARAKLLHGGLEGL